MEFMAAHGEPRYRNDSAHPVHRADTAIPSSPYPVVHTTTVGNPDILPSCAPAPTDRTATRECGGTPVILRP